MELYLRWLDKYEKQAGEETPPGLIFCAQGGHERIDLLQLENAGKQVAEYLTFGRKDPLLQSFPAMISSTTSGSSKVVVSPREWVSPSATFLKMRRMIFPLRVLGRPLTN